MLYVKCLNGIPLKVTDTPDRAEIQRDGYNLKNGWSTRNDWTSFEQVQLLSLYITAMTGEAHLPTDEGLSCSPQFDIVKAPKVGDKVSYGFNGDYTPDGEIVKISKTFQVTTTSGKTYRRKGTTSRWSQPGGTWGLVPGHRSERNPHF